MSFMGFMGFMGFVGFMGFMGFMTTSARATVQISDLPTHGPRASAAASGRAVMSANTSIIYDNIDPSTWKFGSASKDPKSRITTVSVNTRDGGYVRVQLAKDVNDRAQVLFMNDFEKNGQFKMVTSVTKDEEEWWKKVKARIAQELVRNGTEWLGRSVSPDEAESLITIPVQNNDQWGMQTILKVTPRSKCFRFVPSSKPDEVMMVDFQKEEVVRHCTAMSLVSLSKIYITDGMIRLPAYVDEMVVDPSSVPQEPCAFQM